MPTQERPYPWSIADEYSEQGISLTRGNNEVLASINRIKELLKIKKIFIFKSCINSIREVPGYRWAKKREGMASKEEPVKKDDHVMDCIRYMVMAKLGPAPRRLRPGMMTIGELVAEDMRQHKNPNKYKDDEDYMP